MKALVTGASGFVGQYLVRHLIDSGDAVVACHNSTELTDRTPLLVNHPQHSFVRQHAEWVPLAITNKDAVCELTARVRPDVVYHLAGMAFVPEAEENFNRALEVNVAGTYNVFHACDRARLQAVIVLVSSAEVYGRIVPEDLPVGENTHICPSNNYSLSKIMAEAIVSRFPASRGIRSVIMRPFNHIGAGQSDRFVAPNFARQLADIACQQQPAVLRIGNLKPVRDFTDVRDIVRAYRLAALKGQGIYNLGSGKGHSIESLLQTLIEISGVKVTVENDPERMRPSEVPEVRADISKARRDLGWEPEFDIRDTLAEIYRHAFIMASRPPVA